MSLLLATARRTASKSAMSVPYEYRRILRLLLNVQVIFFRTHEYGAVIIGFFQQHLSHHRFFVADIDVGNDRSRYGDVRRVHGFLVDVGRQDRFGIDDFALVDQVDLQAKTLQLFHEHVEAFWYLRTDDLG